jgi:hypothetical protein
LRRREFDTLLGRIGDNGMWTLSSGETLDAAITSDADWERLTEYVHGFEPLYFLIQAGGADATMVCRVFGPRVKQLVRSKRIVERIVSNQNQAPWKDFLILWRMVDPDAYKQWHQFLGLWAALAQRGQSGSGALTARR